MDIFAVCILISKLLEKCGDPRFMYMYIMYDLCTCTLCTIYVHVHYVRFMYMYIMYDLCTCTLCTIYVHVHYVRFMYMYIMYDLCTFLKQTVCLC
jgi:hypothetical protein